MRISSNGMRKCAPSEKPTSSTRDWLCTVIDCGRRCAGLQTCHQKLLVVRRWIISRSSVGSLASIAGFARGGSRSRCAAAQTGAGKARVPVEARDHMPVQVRHHVAERGEVDLGRRQRVAQALLDHGDGFHAQRAVFGDEIGPFGHMVFPDHAIEGRKARFLRVDHAQFRRLEDQPAAGLVAQAGSPRTRAAVTPAPARCRPGWPRATYSGIQFVAEDRVGHLDHDVVGFEQAVVQVVAVAAQALQAARAGGEDLDVALGAAPRRCRAARPRPCAAPLPCGSAPASRCRAA